MVSDGGEKNVLQSFHPIGISSFHHFRLYCKNTTVDLAELESQETSNKTRQTPEKLILSFLDRITTPGWKWKSPEQNIYCKLTNIYISSVNEQFHLC